MHTFLPKYLPKDVYMMDWSKPPFGIYDDESLLFVLILSICTQVLILVYVVIANLHPRLLRHNDYEGQRCRFRYFVFRRLIAQLDRAFHAAHLLDSMPGENEIAFLKMVQEFHLAATNAIRLFQHDAAKAIYPEHDLTAEEAQYDYAVLDEEERQLSEWGYAHVDAVVTDELIKFLLHGPYHTSTSPSPQ